MKINTMTVTVSALNHACEMTYDCIYASLAMQRERVLDRNPLATVPNIPQLRAYSHECAAGWVQSLAACKTEADHSALFKAKSARLNINSKEFLNAIK